MDTGAEFRNSLYRTDAVELLGGLYSFDSSQYWKTADTSLSETRVGCMC